jgi:hypothetical protein
MQDEVVLTCAKETLYNAFKRSDTNNDNDSWING